MRSIWAVATNTIRQALRMKIAAAFIILLLVCLPVMGVSMTGDGTLKGRLQTFVSYGLSLTSILLCLLTIVVSAYSLTSDIKQRQIYTVITKPIRRFQLLLGKLLGVILLDMALLVLFSAIIYGITTYMPKFYNATEAELTQVDNEFYTARASISPPEVDVSQEVKDKLAELDELERTGQLNLEQVFRGLSRKEIIAELTSLKKLEKRAVAVGRELVWEFHNIRPLDPNESLFIRFKYDVSVTPPDSQVYSQWFVGDYRQVKYGMESEVPIYRTPLRKDPVRTFREIEVPADAVTADGYLAVGFLNVPLNNTVVIFPLEDGLEVLYKADTFSANFIRAVLLIFFRLIFLACLGILAASFLSFPVAILFCLMIFFTATFSSFVIESFDFLGENLSSVYSYTIRPVIALLPQFDKFHPTKFLVPGRLLSWHLLAKVAGLMLCIKAPLLLLMGLLIFSFREIAKVII
ncbi:MAG: ABC transporter permease [Sedimentisphaerales bacterium]